METLRFDSDSPLVGTPEQIEAAFMSSVELVAQGVSAFKKAIEAALEASRMHSFWEQ